MSGLWRKYRRKPSENVKRSVLPPRGYALILDIHDDDDIKEARNSTLIVTSPNDRHAVRRCAVCENGDYERECLSRKH